MRSADRDRHTGQVDEVEDVRVDELGRQVEREHVEGPSGQVVLDREQRDPRFPHGRLHVEPRGIRPLGQRVRALVQQLVEDLEALVGQPDLVGVGIDEQPRHPGGGVLRTEGTLLTADVAGRLGDALEQRFDARPERLHGAASLGPRAFEAPQPCDGPVVVVVVVDDLGAAGVFGAVAAWEGGLFGVGRWTAPIGFFTR